MASNGTDTRKIGMTFMTPAFTSAEDVYKRQKDDVVIMDMEAGLEHLGRGTASMMDQFIVVSEPGARSVQTYVDVYKRQSYS